MRRALELPQRQAVRPPGPWPVRPRADHHVEHAALAEPAEDGVLGAGGQRPAVPRGHDSRRQAEEDLPVAQRPRGRREQRRRILRGVAHGQEVEPEVVVVALERAHRRQDERRVARGLVQVEVHRDHEVEAGQGPLQAPAVGRREHRVAGHREQGAHLPRAGRVHLFRQRRRRPFAAELRQPAHPRAAGREPPALAEARGQGDDVRGRAREHHPALAVEVAGDHVDDVHQPAGEAAELLGGDADAAVADGRGRLREFPGQPHDVGGRDARRLLDARGRECARELPTVSMPSVKASRRPGRARPSASSVWSSASSSRASVPGRMGRCQSASAAVSVRRGSTTTSRPPRSFSAEAAARCRARS